MLLNRLDYDRQKVIDFVLSCRNADGGFGGNTNLDSHILYTLSAVQILSLYDALDEIDKEKTAS